MTHHRFPLTRLLVLVALFAKTSCVYDVDSVVLADARDQDASSTDTGVADSEPPPEDAAAEDSAVVEDGPVTDAPPQQVTVSTFAGTGAPGQDDGLIVSATFRSPTGITLDLARDRIYVADTGNNVIRKIEQGTVSTFAGTIVGYNDGPANQARFAAPSSVAVDSTGDKVYVVDFLNSCIRLIEGGQVSSFAGQCQSPGFSNGPVDTAKFSFPADLALDGSGSRILVADSMNHRIRLIENGQVSTIAGTGKKGHVDGPAASAELDTPVEVTIGPDGKIYVAERGQSQRIRMLDPSSNEVSTIAGSGNAGFADGPAAVASFNDPAGLAVLPNGVIYIADTNNHRIRVYAQNRVGTLAGVGTPGHKDGPGNVAFFNKPNRLAVDLTTGVGYVADTENHRIRLITP